jgi:hypothetical protein
MIINHELSKITNIGYTLTKLINNILIKDTKVCTTLNFGVKIIQFKSRASNFEH